MRGIIFNATKNFTLNSFQFYDAFSGASTMTITLVDNLGTIIQTVAGSATSSDATAGFHTVTLASPITVTVGTGWQLRCQFTAGSLNTCAFNSGVSFSSAPFNNLGSAGAITGSYNAGTVETTSYYYFYNMSITSNGTVTTSCASNRSPVTVFVTPSPVLNVAAGNHYPCNNEIVKFKITAGADSFNVKTWSPAANLFTNSAATTPYVAGASADSVYAKTNVAGTYIFIVNALNTTSGCNAIAEDSMIVAPATITVTAVPANLCLSGSSTISINQVPNFALDSIQWMSSADSITFTNVNGARGSSYVTPVQSANAFYRAVYRNGLGAVCFTKDVAVYVNNPQILSVKDSSRCGIGNVTLEATGSNLTSLSWYANASGGSPLSNAASAIAVTGFNSDVVASGIGANTVAGISQPGIGLDGQGYAFIDNTFQYSPSSALPTCFMPTNNLAPSLQSSGLTYILASYTGNNALSLANASSGYTSPYPSAGTLTLADTTKSYASLKVLYESVVYTSGNTVNATVNFTDGTSQAITGNTFANWFTVAAPAFNNVGRTTPTGTIQCAATPNLFELNLAISAGNQAKHVKSINFNIPTVLTGATSQLINYFHAMAVGGSTPVPANQFITPVLTSTTTYYVSANALGSVQADGLGSTIVPTASGFNAKRGIQFNATQAFTLVSFQTWYAFSGTATATVELSDNTGAVISTTPVSVVTTDATPGWHTFVVNMAIPAGTGLRLQASWAGSTSNFSHSTGVSYATGPWNNLGSVGAITAGLDFGPVVSSTSYWYFYNLSVLAGCTGPRVPVVATVFPPPALTLSSAKKVVCNNAIQQIDISSTVSDFDTYVWSPATNLYTNALATTPYVAGSSASTVYFKSTVAGTTLYSVRATNNTTGCVNISANDTIINLPSAITIAAIPASICFSGPATLTLAPVAGFIYAGSQWEISTDSISWSPVGTPTTINYTTDTISTRRYYRTSISGSNGVCLSVGYTLEVYSPSITSTTDSIRCGVGTVNLHATTATAGATINWFANATGGASLGTGTTFTTPVIASTTTYYAAALIGSSLSSATIGTGTTPNGTTSYPAVYGSEFTGHREQYLVKASELQAMGITAGSINGITFNVITPNPQTNTVGSGPALQNFKIRIGSTAVSALTTTFQTTPTTLVYSSPSQATTAGNNTHTFTTSFPWDGASNIIVEVTHLNDNGGCPTTSTNYSNNAVMNMTTTPFVSVTSFIADATCTAPTNPTGTNYSTRPNFTFAMTQGCSSGRVPVVANVTSAPAITVSSDTTVCQATSTTLVASSMNTGYAYTWTPGPAGTSSYVVTPSVTTTYHVAAVDTTSGSLMGCTAAKDVKITVVQRPTINSLTVTPSAICKGDSAQINLVTTPVIAPTFVGAYAESSLSGQAYSTLSGGGITVINTTAQLTSGMGSGNQDDGGVLVTLPFTFTYNSNTFTQMTFCTNGWVGAGDQSTIDAVSMRVSGNLFTSTIPNNTIAAWFKDMGGNFPTGTGSMRHGLIGTDVYAFQWDNATGSGFSDGSAILISFQINIYGPASSSPGRIEMVYGPTVGSIATSSSIGIEDGIGGIHHYRNSVSGTDSTTDLALTWPGNGNGFRYNALPPSNLSYLWTPSLGLSSTTDQSPKASPPATRFILLK